MFDVNGAIFVWVPGMPVLAHFICEVLPGVGGFLPEVWGEECEMRAKLKEAKEAGLSVVESGPYDGVMITTVMPASWDREFILSQFDSAIGNGSFKMGGLN